MSESPVDLSRFFALSIDMFCVSGADGFLKRVNPAFEKALGYSKEELLSIPFLQFVHPDDAAATAAELEKLSAGASTLHYENRYCCKDGSYKWLQWTSYPIDSLLFSVARDISEQKRIQSALEQSESMFKALFQTASIGTMIVDQRGEIVTINEKAGEIFNYSIDELIGAPIEKLLPNRLGEAHKRYRAEYLDNPYVRPMGVNLELLGSRKDGTEFPVEVGLSFVKSSTETLALAFVVDITPRKQHEEERERLIEELKAFAHTVAHELKAPLALILGYSGLLRTDSDEYTPQQMSEGLETIERTSRKMNDIVNELLVLASVRDMEDVELAPLDMEAIFLEAQERLIPMIGQHDASIHLPGSWPVSTGYSPWVEEIWVNYLANGIKYGGRPPRLEIGAAVHDEELIKYWVSDNGQGIEEEMIAPLFDQFTRLDRKGADGHGLGLSIVRRIAERLGGAAGAESLPGQGSTFFFTLPRVLT